MSRKGVKFSGKVTPLFDSILVPHQAPEGEGSEQPIEPNKTRLLLNLEQGDATPYTDSSSSHDTTQDSRDSLEGTNESEGDQVQPSHDSNLLGGPTSDRAKGGMTLEELSVLCTNLSNRVLCFWTPHKAWLRSVSRLSMKRKLGRNESDYMDTEEPVNEGRLSKETEELNVTHDTEVLEKGESNEEPVSVAGNTGVSTAILEVSTATLMTPPTTKSVFEDEDIFLADALEEQLAAERSATIRNKPRQQNSTEKPNVNYLNHTSRYKHAQLNKKTLEEIQAPIHKTKKELHTLGLLGLRRMKERIEEDEIRSTGVDEEELMEVQDISRLSLKWFQGLCLRQNERIMIIGRTKEWILKSWNFYNNCGVHILVLEDETKFFMLAERRYPLTKETLERMLALRLIAEFESEVVFDLLRFIQKQIDESGIHDGSIKNWLVQSKRLLIYSMVGEDEFHDDNPPPVTPTQQAPHTLSTIKLHILKKVQVSTDTNGQIRVLPPKTAEEILARERERKARTTVLMSIPEDHLAKFHKIIDAKDMWEAIKSKFGGNDESKKMQKYILKQQFESFSVSNSEGLHKRYDRFQSLMSQLEIHGAGVSTEDANKKFLMSLPASWSQVSLIMRTKPEVDTFSFNDLYNNLKVFESDIKGSTASSSILLMVSTSSGHNSQKEGSSSYTDELKYSFFANQSSGPQLDHEDLEQKEKETRTTLLMSMPEDHLAKFHKMTDAKEMREAIKSRFGGNDESKKMFQSLLSQLEIHDAYVSTEDANQKFLRSLPASWSQESLIMRTKPRVDTLSFDDLYNNLRVFMSDVKGSTALSSSTQNVVFVSSESTSSTNDEGSSYYEKFTSRLAHLAPLSPEIVEVCVDDDDTDEDDDYDDDFYDCGDIEEEGGEIDFDISKIDDIPLREKLTGHAEDKQENSALMAYSNSGSNTEVTSCLKECEESYVKLKKLYDEQREQLGDASIEIQAYTQALKKVEAQLVCHQQNQLVFEEKIMFMKIDLDDKTNVLTYHKKLLAEIEKEKEELKTKLKFFQSSSKGLSKLLNSQMSAKEKSGLGYRDQIHEGVLSYENEVLESVFDSRPSDVEDSPVYDRFSKVEGMHVVPPPMTGIYMPPKSDFGIDKSNFTYGLKQSKTSESAANTSDFVSCESNSSVNLKFGLMLLSLRSMSQTVMMNMETVKEQNTCSPSPKADKRDWNGLMSKKLGLGYGFTKKACFVCGSFSHLIRDCDFHEKRIAKQVELNKKKGKGTGQGENRPVWNNVQRLNHQNKFVPKAVLTKTGIFPVNTARQNLSSQAATTSTARKVNTARPIVNDVRPRPIFNKTHSPIRRPFNRTTTPKTDFSNQKVNTAGNKAVSAVGGIKETAVKTSAGCNWRSKRHYWNKFSKYNSGSNSSKNVNSKDPLGRPESAKACVPKRN
ncbi:hypothetical protein Tco_0364963 [Tanacetum coccineum]